MDDSLTVSWRDTNQLGEGPHWSAREQVLYWVDIEGHCLHRLDPASKAHTSWTLAHRPSVVAERVNGGLLLATEAGLCDFDPRSGELGVPQPLEPERPHNRSNDGGCDPQGRFWIGTMSESGDPQAPPGALYRVDPDRSVTRVRDDIEIPNTLAWSPDGRTLYFGDSGKQTLFQFAFDPTDGSLGPARSFVSTRGETPTPDGSCVDVDGYLWNCQWDGWRVVRYSPRGEIDRVIEMPVARPTSCCFGGPELDTLFITSARVGLSEHELAKQPLAGSVFALRPGVRGLPTTLFRG